MIWYLKVVSHCHRKIKLKKLWLTIGLLYWLMVPSKLQQIKHQRTWFQKWENLIQNLWLLMSLKDKSFQKFHIYFWTASPHVLLPVLILWRANQISKVWPLLKNLLWMNVSNFYLKAKKFFCLWREPQKIHSVDSAKKQWPF